MVADRESHPSAAALAPDREVQRDELDATLDDLQRLVRVLRRIGGFMPHEDQQALRAAEARLAQHGRSVEQLPARNTR